MASASVPRPKSSLAKDFVFSDGTWVPKLIYGTAWKGDRTADLVYTAIRMGFRGIDTAAQPKHYREDLVAEGVKRAIAEGIVTREELFVSSLSSITSLFPFSVSPPLSLSLTLAPNQPPPSPRSRSKPNSPLQRRRIHPACPTRPTRRSRRRWTPRSATR